MDRIAFFIKQMLVSASEEYLFVKGRVLKCQGGLNAA